MTRGWCASNESRESLVSFFKEITEGDTETSPYFPHLRDSVFGFTKHLPSIESFYQYTDADIERELQHGGIHEVLVR